MADRPEVFEGVVTIEWRASGQSASPTVMPGWTFAIRDPGGEMITTVTDLTFHAPGDGLVWAELTMFCDAEGRPILAGTPDEISARWVAGDDGIRTATFPFLVAGMSVAG
jgi:hypothetical protein